MLLIVEYEKYIFLATYFSLTPADQETSAEMILKEIASMKKPVFMAGGYEFYTFFQPIRIQKCLPMTVSDIICLLNQQSAQVVVIVLILSINFMFVFYLSCSHLFL